MEESSSNTESLLNKTETCTYYSNCPGCKVESLKQRRRGVPYKEFSYIWLVSLCTALPTTSLYPFLYFMIRDFRIAKREEDIGFYAGFMGSSFMAGRALTSIFWGMAADKYGRRPIILIGTLSVLAFCLLTFSVGRVVLGRLLRFQTCLTRLFHSRIVFNTLFGLSPNFWMALSMRFILGCFNSLLGTIRAYASEICREEHHGLALSVVSTSRGIGLVIGPAVGGFFAMPAEKYPNIFASSSIFGRFPYFLPCFIISAYAAVIFTLSWWLPETLHMHKEKKNIKSNAQDALKNPTSENADKKHNNVNSADKASNSQGNLFKNWPLMSTIIVYCVFSLQEMAYSEIFSLWAVSDKKYGGLSFSSQDVGVVLAISGFGLLLFQLFVYPQIEKRLGPLVVTRLSAVVSIPILASYPFIALLSGLMLHLVINVVSLLRNALSVSLVTGLFIMLNDAVPQRQRGAANGISMTAMSIFKAIAPAGGGAIFSWAQKRQHAAFLPGDEMVFFVLNAVQIVGLLLTFKPFLAQPDEQ